jgi:hypothetical protein
LFHYSFIRVGRFSFHFQFQKKTSENDYLIMVNNSLKIHLQYLLSSRFYSKLYSEKLFKWENRADYFPILSSLICISFSLNIGKLKEITWSCYSLEKAIKNLFINFIFNHDDAVFQFFRKCYSFSNFKFNLSDQLWLGQSFKQSE